MGFGESLARALAALADPLHEPVLLAIPVFVLFVAIEWVSARVLEAREPGGYQPRDAVIMNFPGKFLENWLRDIGNADFIEMNCDHVGASKGVWRSMGALSVVANQKAAPIASTIQ